MTATIEVPRLNQDTQRLVDAVVQDLMAAQAGAPTRDLGPDTVGAQSGNEEPTVSQPETQRFFGAVLSSCLSYVIPKVSSHILGMLQQRRRELGLPEQRDAVSVERDLQAILAALIPKIVDAIPGLVSAISGQPAPRSPEEEGQRFLPFLAALIPAVVSAVPAIIGAFNQQRGVDATPPPITDPDVAQRFFGPLLAALVPQLIEAAPTILGSIFGGRRDVVTRTW
jgi:hypothetical protein